MTNIRPASIAEHIDEIDDLLRANWGETGFDFELNLNKDGYRALEDAGMMYAVAVFNDEEKIVGYCSFTLTRHLYNPSVVCANTDALYLLPEYRNGALSGQLMYAVRDLAKVKGAHMILWHARGNTVFAARLSKTTRFEWADAVYMEKL